MIYFFLMKKWSGHPAVLEGLVSVFLNYFVCFFFLNKCFISSQLIAIIEIRQTATMPSIKAI